MKKTILLIFIIIGLVAYIVWAVDPVSTLEDSSGLGLSLTKGGQSPLALIPPADEKFNTSMWQGKDAFVYYNRTSNNFVLNSGDNKTIEGWFYHNQTDGATDLDYIFGWGDLTNTVNLRFIVNDGLNNLSLTYNRGTNNTNYVHPTNLSDSTWHHFAVIFYNTSVSGSSKLNMRFFIDGVIATTQTRLNPFTAATPQLIIATDNTESEGRVFIGGLDEFRVSNNTEYLLAFTAPTSQFPITSGTVALYHFNNNEQRVKFLNQQFLNFSTKSMGTPNQFWLNTNRNELCIVYGY